MPDRIEVRGIRAYGRHGANPGERDRAQAFDLDLELELDLARARVSDDLRDTLDYAALHALALAVVREHSYALLERLGDELARAIMRDQRVRRAIVRIAKPGLLDGATPAVTVSAERG